MTSLQADGRTASGSMSARGGSEAVSMLKNGEQVGQDGCMLHSHKNFVVPSNDDAMQSPY